MFNGFLQCRYCALVVISFCMHDRQGMVERYIVRPQSDGFLYNLLRFMHVACLVVDECELYARLREKVRVRFDGLESLRGLFRFECFYKRMAQVILSVLVFRIFPGNASEECLSIREIPLLKIKQSYFQRDLLIKLRNTIEKILVV